MAENSDPKAEVSGPLMVKGYDDKFLAILALGSHARYTVSIHNPEGLAESSMVIDEETGFRIWEWLGKQMGIFESVDLDQYKV